MASFLFLIYCPSKFTTLSPIVLQTTLSFEQIIAYSFAMGPPDWGLGEELTIPHRKNQFVTKFYTRPLNWWAFMNKVTNLLVS